ncbi:MAG: DUF2911 domain-containing protein [Catalinimonas sp.]
MKPYRCFFLCCALLSAHFAAAQIITPKARVSQIVLTNYETDDAYVKIHYGQPYRKGRAIFGALVPYGQVWRTGANEATEITTTADLQIEGKTLPAGTYSIYTVPRPDRWTVIFNRDLGAGGAYEYDAKQDVLRVDVPTVSTPETYEAFMMKLQGTDEEVDIQMMWDQTLVSLPVRIMPRAQTAPITDGRPRPDHAKPGRPGDIKK